MHCAESDGVALADWENLSRTVNYLSNKDAAQTHRVVNETPGYAYMPRWRKV
jgi:hypothetical protein